MSATGLWVKFFDPGDGVTYDFHLTEDDAEQLLKLGTLRQNSQLAIAGIDGHARFDGENLHLHYRNGNRGFGIICISYRAACQQLQEQLAMLGDGDCDDE